MLKGRGAKGSLRFGFGIGVDECSRKKQYRKYEWCTIMIILIPMADCTVLVGLMNYGQCVKWAADTFGSGCHGGIASQLADGIRITAYHQKSKSCMSVQPSISVNGEKFLYRYEAAFVLVKKHNTKYSRYLPSSGTANKTMSSGTQRHSPLSTRERGNKATWTTSKVLHSKTWWRESWVW